MEESLNAFERSEGHRSVGIASLVVCRRAAAARGGDYPVTGWWELVSSAGVVLWLKRAAMLLSLLAAGGHPLIAQNQEYYFAPHPVTLAPDGAAQPYACQTATCATNNSGSEVFYTKKTGAGSCTQFWSMSINGANITNLSSVYTGLPTPTTYNVSSPRWSPDGTWFVIEAQDTHTSRACTSVLAKPGIGLGYGLYACRVANTTCYELAIEGDNTGHFCTAGVACPVQTSLLDYVDDNHGVLHYHFTPDGTKIYGMYVMGTGNSPEVEGINGTLRWATITLPGSGAPTLSNVTETDVEPLGDGTGTYNWYEGAGAQPTSVESSTCTIFATGVNNADGQLNHTGVLKYNICTQAYAWLAPQNCYQEWWEVRAQGDIAVGTTCQYLPSSLPFSYAAGIAGPLDLAYGLATVGKTAQLTFFNNLNPLGNPITNMSDPCWDWTGAYVLLDYVPADNATHDASASYILRFTLTTTEAVTTVSAADYVAPVAPDSVITLFGANIASQVVVATSPPPAPLPTSLGNVSAIVTDVLGHQGLISLIAVTPSQVNAVLPTGLQPGPAVIDLTTSSGAQITGPVTLVAVAPSLFTVNESGRGLAAAQVVIAHADGSQTFIPAIATCSSSGCTPIPINLGSSTDQAYLALFGTGIRGAGGASNVTATVGNTPCHVTYAGPQNTYFGLDQVDVELPHSLAGSGTVNVAVTAAGQAANTVTVDIQ